MLSRMFFFFCANYWNNVLDTTDFNLPDEIFNITPQATHQNNTKCCLFKTQLCDFCFQVSMLVFVWSLTSACLELTAVSHVSCLFLLAGCACTSKINTPVIAICQFGTITVKILFKRQEGSFLYIMAVLPDSMSQEFITVWNMFLIFLPIPEVHKVKQVNPQNYLFATEVSCLQTTDGESCSTKKLLV